VNSVERRRWETFIVRLWREQADGTWRGKIVHLATRESAYFSTLAQIETFIRRFADGIENSRPDEAAQPDPLMMEETDDESQENA
jgi:hypothetical protein